MLMTREDRVGKGFCPGCNFEIPKDTTYVDALCYFAGGYSQLCTWCEDFDNILYEFHLISRAFDRAIENVKKMGA